MSDLENLVYSLIERYMSGGSTRGATRYHERHGIVTSYDPERYLAKVVYMPDGQESGWLPIEASHIGDSYGVAIGLQPGDGSTTGDQVIVRFQEGDNESGKIVQRVHSDSDKPPTVQSGEIVIWSKFKKSTGNSGLGDDQTEGGDGGDDDEAQSGQGGSGQQFYFKNDGSATVTDGNGATIALDGKSNITVTATNGTITKTAKGDITITSTGGNVAVNANSAVTVTAPVVNTVGSTHLGSEGGVQVAKLGTVDTMGAADIVGLAGSVYAT